MKVVTLAAAVGFVWMPATMPGSGAAAQPFDIDLDMQAEIKAANDALSHAHDNLGGMGGLGTIPEPDFGTIQGMLGAGETMLRDARRRAQEASTPDQQIWVVGYARAARAMIETAFEYKTKRGYQ